MAESDIVRYAREGDRSGVASCISADPQAVNAKDKVSYLSGMRKLSCHSRIDTYICYHIGNM